MKNILVDILEGGGSVLIAPTEEVDPYTGELVPVDYVRLRRLLRSGRAAAEPGPGGMTAIQPRRRRRRRS